MKDSTKYSYSRLETYEKCPFKYKLVYIDKKRVFSNSIATEFGTAIHMTEESIMNCLKSAQPINYIKLKNDFIITMAKLEQKYRHDFLEPDKTGRLYSEKGYYYLENSITNLENWLKADINVKIVGAEVKFSTTIGEKIFAGSIDRLLFDEKSGVYYLQDIKTWPEIKGHDIKAPLQFAVYAHAVKEIYHVDYDKIKCQYYLPLVNETYTAELPTREIVAHGEEELCKDFSRIESGDFHPIPSALCAWCEYSATNPNQPEAGKNLCPYHSIWKRDLREKGTATQPACKWTGLENYTQVLEQYKLKYGASI